MIVDIVYSPLMGVGFIIYYGNTFGKMNVYIVETLGM